MSAAVSLDALRARIRAIEGSAQVQRRRIASGVEVFDHVVGGLPCPGIVEISGPLGSGRTRLVLALVAAATRERDGGQRRTVAWVDPLRRLYPPAAAAAGVALDRLLIVRPPAASIAGTHPEVWATEQLLRSGNFPLVVCDAPLRSAPADASRHPDGGRRARGPRAAGHQWARAAERGQCAVIVLSERPQRDVPADVRIAVDDGELRVIRDRGSPGHAGAVVPRQDLLVPWFTTPKAAIGAEREG